ncbi:hypothetical protein TKK_0018071 [Trichogramma kaykai]
MAKRKLSEKEKIAIVKESHERKQSLKQFCKDHNLKLRALFVWRKQYGRVARSTAEYGTGADTWGINSGRFSEQFNKKKN